MGWQLDLILKVFPYLKDSLINQTKPRKSYRDGLKTAGDWDSVKERSIINASSDPNSPLVPRTSTLGQRDPWPESALMFLGKFTSSSSSAGYKKMPCIALEAEGD